MIWFRSMPPINSPKKEALLAIGLNQPTAAILAAAKAKGIVVSRTYVDLLKKQAGIAPTHPRAPRKGGAAKPAAAPKAAAPKAAPKATAKPAAKPAPKPAAKPAPKPAAKPAAPAPKASGDAEAAFRAAAARLIVSRGLTFAQTALDQVVAKITAAVG